jgi:hypothetical protein
MENLKIATILKNDSEIDRIDLYIDTEISSLYYIEEDERVIIEASEGWTTLENYADVCRAIWQGVWKLQFEEIEEEINLDYIAPQCEECHLLCKQSVVIDDCICFTEKHDD